MTPDGIKYGDGKNKSLNTIHNADKAFGEFWDYYRNSEYTKNTILIVTSDHCSYHEKSHVKAFGGKDYQRIFVDKIPLMIFDPEKNLPSHFDASSASSLDLAPSLVHYMGLENAPNSFLGTSIFERNLLKKGALR
mgnify:CR=1 FL=1